MEKKTIRQFSLLGLALMGVSALTAAITPSKPAPLQTNSANDGKAKQFSADNAAQDVLSCVATVSAKDCNITTGTASTAAGGLGTRVQTINGHRYDTVGNTSASQQGTGHLGDTTSVLVQVA